MGNKENRNENANIKKIKFFSDQPIAADKEQDIRFGHLDIADNLKKIILNCPSPFTIGLFGKWGSGKTTILNALRKKLQDNNKDNIAVVNFDVWKYAGDSLRRTFLKEIVKQLQKTSHLPKNYKLNERLEKSIQKIIENRKFVCNWKLLLCLIGFILAISLFLYTKYPQNFGTYLSILFGSVTTISALFVWMIQQAITHEKLVVSSERLQDPYEFEEEFNKITKEISSKNLLIIIDNLDRCIHNKAVELLSTIKTFLAKDTEVYENNKCIFLIACDDEAIKAHLKSVYPKNQNDGSVEDSFSADEFLRKFFNVSLRIPDFIDTELQLYTEDLLKEIDIPQFDSPDISYVITNAFRENPRQIKQFINILITNFYLAQGREENKEPLIIPKGTITDNVAFLAKFLIIHQKFPKEYQQIRESHLNINEIENIEDEKYKDFLRATKTITVNDIRPFMYLKQSEEERAIPGVKELELGLIDNKCEAVKEKINTIKTNPNQIKNLKRFILSLIDRNESRRTPLFNIISCLLEAFNCHNLKLSKQLCDKIAGLLNNGKYLKDDLEKFKPSLIFNEVLNQCNTEDSSGIIDQYVNILSQKKEDKKEPRISIDYAHVLFKELLEHKELLNQDKREKIRQILTEIYYTSPKIFSLFSENVEDQKDYISGKTISKFISTFSNDDVENKKNINEKVGLLLKFKEVITFEVAQEIIISLQNLLKNENQKAYREEKENLLNCIGDVFNVLYDQILNIPDKSVLNSFADIIILGMNALGNWNQKKIFIFICIRLVDILESSQKTGINTLIQNFFTNADIDSIQFVFKKLSEEEKKELIAKHSGVFQQRVLEQQPIFNFLYSLAPQDLRIQWMTNLITSYPQRATAKLKELNYKVDDKTKVVETLLSTARRVAIHEKKNLCEAINQMKCANDAKFRSDFASQIKSLLRSTDKSQQEVGYLAYEGAKHFSNSLKRDIIREIVEWLRSLQLDNAGQTYTIKSALIDWDILQSPVKKDYIDFVFDKLIKRGVNINNIQLGFEIFYKVKPKYEEYPTYFDDVFERLKSESNDQIKTEIKSGLLKLKPSETNKKNKDFWDKLEKYK